VTTTEDKKIDDNLKRFRRNMRLSIQRKLREGEKEEVCADDAQAEGDLSLYDSTDEYGDEEIKNMR